MNARIAHVLRHAAGLPAIENPFTREEGRPDLRFVVSAILGATGMGNGWVRTPKAVAKELEYIRLKWKYLRAQINGLDDGTRAALELIDAEAVATTPGLIGSSAIDNAVAAMNRLDWCIQSAEGHAAAMAAKRPKASTKGGRPADHRKGAVALLAASYLKNVTGRIWIGDEPPGWEIDKSTEPFAVALREIFDILGLGTKIKNAVSYATSKLPK